MSSGPVEDRLAIRELAERYCDGINRGDPEVWGSGWAEDSAWFHGGVRTEGRENIIASWLKSLVRIEAIGFFCMMGEVNVVGDAATGRVYNHQLAKLKDGKIMKGVYIYDDKYVKVNGEWYFKERLLEIVLHI